MSKLNNSFENFGEFYKNAVQPLIELNPTFKRLDGCLSGSSIKAFGYFMFDGQKWKVDSDTHIDKLRIAYKLFIEQRPTFKSIKTKGGKGQCLIIVGQPIQKKMLYIYKVS